MLNQKFSPFQILIAILILLSGIRIFFVVFTPIGLSTEEAQYWLWSQHLDWSYYSKPVMVALMNFFSTAIFGNTELGIRINAILLGFLVPLIAYFFGRSMFKNEQTALYGALLFAVMPSYHMSSILFLTDAPLALFWLLCFWFFWEATEKNKPKYWILLGMAAGLGFLSKYVIVLFAPLALIYLWKFKRALFKEKWLYGSLLIACLFLLPVIIWNMQNEFVTFKHVGTLSGVQGIPKKEVTMLNRLSYIGEYIGGQLGINSIFMFPFYIGALVFATKRFDDRRLFYLAIPILFIFTFFIFIAFKKRVEVNWPAFAYMTLPLLTAYYLGQKRIWKKARISIILSAVFIPLFIAPYAFDWMGLDKVFKPKVDPSGRLYGYEHLANKIDSLIVVQNLDKYFVISDSYHFVSEMAFYMEGNPQTYCINNGRRMNQFDLWPGVEQFENQGYSGIFINTWRTAPKRVTQAFESLELKMEVPIIYRGQEYAVFHIYLYNNFKEMEQHQATAY